MEPATQGDQDQPIIPKDKSNFKQTTLDGFFKKKSPAKDQEKSTGKTSENEEFKVDRTDPATTDPINEPQQTSNKNLDSKPESGSEEVKRNDITTPTNDNPELKNETKMGKKTAGNAKKYYILPHKSSEWPFIKSQLELLSKGSVDQADFYSILTQFANIHQATKDQKNNFKLLRAALGTFGAFFEEILPFMATLALKIEILFPEDLPVLSQTQPDLLYLTKPQSNCLLFHMFFCTTLSQENSLLPRNYSFLEWYNSASSNKNPRDSTKISKLECFLNYAKRMKENLPELETISFERVYLDSLTEIGADAWSKATELLNEVVIKDGSISEAKGTLQIDFANKYLGGGVLRTGCVQEEIMFAVAPDHHCGILFTECLLPTEAAIIKGAAEYSKHTGYGDSFRYAGNLESEKLPRDERGRLDVITVAIDALNFREGEPSEQFKVENVLREMNKAFVGFRGSVIDENAEADRKKDVATGRWGCGVFKGDPQLKFVIQWLASARAQRSMLFYPFGDKTLALAAELSKQYAGKTAGELFRSVLDFVEKTKGQKDSKIFEYLLQIRSNGELFC